MLNPETASAELIATALAAETSKVREGEDAKIRRAGLIRRAHHADPQTWTQAALANAAGISQPAVSKILSRTPGADSLDAEMAPAAYTLGRLLGLGHYIAQRLDRGSKAVDMVDKIFEGKWPITTESVEQVRRLIDRDIASYGHAVRKQVRTALTEIDENLVIPPGTMLLDQNTHVQLMLGHDHQYNRLTQKTTAAEQEE
jgi:transcriptional regulator with XRE-family HTH domain